MLDGALTPDDPVMLIKVGKTAALANTPDEFYESARKWWSASPVQAGKAHRILALDGNTVVDVYEPRRWEVSDAPDTEGKVAFHGVPARDRETFVGLSMDHLFPKGAANPVRYTTVAALTPAGPPEAPGPASVEQEEVIHRQDGLYLLLLRINQSWHDGIPAEELYNATRGYWKVSATRVEQVSRVFAVADGVVREVYEPLTWEPSPFPGEEHRNGFQGVVASDRDRWVGRDVSSVFPLGSQNPVTYVDAEDLATALPLRKPSRKSARQSGGRSPTSPSRSPRS